MNRSADLVGPAPRVLIVDDERNNREVLESMLGPEGFVILNAASGQEALAITAQEQPDIILLDVLMPVMDGYQVVASLKSDTATMDIPVILITCLEDHGAKMLGLDAGAEDFLSRPVDRAELQVRVRNLLRLKALGDHHRRYGQALESEVTARTAELVESERRYRQIVESTTDGIVKLDAGGAVVFANQRFADMLGCELSELIGTSAMSFLDPPAQTVVIEALQRRSRGVTETYEVTGRRKDGGELSMSLACTPILDERGRFEGALASARDVTEQKKLMAQLAISDRMASIGILAAGVAHEINNPLACLMANLDLAARAVLELGGELGVMDRFGEVTEELHDAREATQRIRNIVRDMKVFSSSEHDKTGPVDVQRIMESTLRMAWNEIRHRARLVKNYGNTPPVEASEARLGQVFLNIVVNAAQAIAEGRAQSNEIRISTRADPGGMVVIDISDTGPGMPPEVLCRLFTPFFTTKPLGVGTGLGLSICHRIVTGFGGTIDVTSELGKGTTFRIALPLSRAEVSDEVPPQVALDTPARRRGRILLVDDEPMVAKVVQRTLSREHEVVATASAADALERIVAGEQFDVVLCDLMMPQMTGMDLHSELSRVAGEQAARMIFLTGGAFTPLAQSFLDEISNERIEKPFDVRHLRAIVNDRIR